MRYTRTKGGGISGSCDSCGRQTFDRSPRAVAALEKKLGDKGNGKGAPGTAAAPAGGFDIRKL